MQTQHPPTGYPSSQSNFLHYKNFVPQQPHSSGTTPSNWSHPSPSYLPPQSMPQLPVAKNQQYLPHLPPNNSKNMTPSQSLPCTVNENSKSPKFPYTQQEILSKTAVIKAMLYERLPKNATMIYCFQTQFNTLKNEHILIFAKHYLADYETATASKTEFNKYFPNQMSAQFPRGASLRLRLVKLTNSPPGSSELTLLGFDKSTESGIDFVKNMLEAEARHILKNAGSPKRKQFDVKVEELPISQFRNVPMAQSIPSQHDFKQDQIPRSSSNSNNNNITAPKTYHSFTILPKNRLSNVSVRQRRFRSQDEMPNGNFPMTSQRTSFQGQSPDVYIVDEKIATRCPSAEVASSFTSFQSQQTPQYSQAPDPWQYHSPPHVSQDSYPPGRIFARQPSYTDPTPPPSFPSPPAILQSEWKIQSCEDLLNEIKSEAALFENERNSPRRPPAKVAPAASAASSVDQNKPQPIRGTKRRESGRTFCNGAKAIVSYFSLDGNPHSRASKQRRTASPFSELNAAASAIAAMP